MNVYLKAAKLVAKDIETFSCCAIDAAVHIHNSYIADTTPERDLYTSYFAPRGASTGLSQAWLEHRVRQDEQKEWRLTALCFAAAMHDKGDL